MDHSNFIDFMELKLMMEKLGEPQTHLGLKEMIKAVDEDNDGQISFREVTLSLAYFFSISLIAYIYLFLHFHPLLTYGPKLLTYG